MLVTVGDCEDEAFNDERPSLVKLSFSSPASCKNVQLRFVHVSLRKYAEQYFVVP